MAKSLHDDVFDGALNVIKNNCTRMTLCSAQPTTYTEGNATYALADATMASGDFTVSDGDTNGRKVRVATKTGITVDANGTGIYVALLDVSNSKLLAVTTCPSKVVTTADLVDFSVWDIEIADPT